MSQAYLKSSAVLSDCGVYRYQLERRWADGQIVLWIMLNPSTADGRQDDRTIGRCVDFSRRWGFGGLLVGNLFALRATKPSALADHCDPIGPRNRWNLSLMYARASQVVAAWGSNVAVTEDLVVTSLDLFTLNKAIVCLGVTKRAAPRHPLYVPANFQPEKFTP